MWDVILIIMTLVFFAACFGLIGFFDALSGSEE